MTAAETKAALSAQYPYRIELHAHTSPVSGCSEIPPKDLVRIYHKKGFHGVVITNHFIPSLLSMSEEKAIDWYLSDYEKAVAAAESYEIKVYLGAEIRFSENINDYLIYGVNRDILKNCYRYLKGDVTTFREKMPLPDSVFIQAHPMRNNMEHCDPGILDGMECMNLHPNHNSRVGLATRYAYKNGLPIKTAGTDCHHPGHEALTALRTRQLPADSFEIAQILKSGDYLFELGDSSLWLP